MRLQPRNLTTIGRLRGWTQTRKRFRKKSNKAVHFEPQIETEADLKKIKEPIVEYDEQATKRRYDMMHDIFGGILTVRLHGRFHFRCHPMDDIMTWMGLENSMTNMVEEPELMHRALHLYMDGQISRVRQYEKLGILSSNNSFENIGSNCVGYTGDLPPVTENGIGAKLSDIWGENADQTLTCVSPDMTREFAFEHQKKWAALFGLHSYGCCERLDNKLNLLTSAFPNLRKVSCSPYSDLESTMEQLGDRYVISFKTSSSHLAGHSPNTEYLKNEIVRACELTQKYKVNLVDFFRNLFRVCVQPRNRPMVVRLRGCKRIDSKEV